MFVPTRTLINMQGAKFRVLLSSQIMRPFLLLELSKCQAIVFLILRHLKLRLLLKQTYNISNYFAAHELNTTSSTELSQTMIWTTHSHTHWAGRRNVQTFRCKDHCVTGTSDLTLKDRKTPMQPLDLMGNYFNRGLSNFFMDQGAAKDLPTWWSHVQPCKGNNIETQISHRPATAKLDPI